MISTQTVTENFIRQSGAFFVDSTRFESSYGTDQGLWARFVITLFKTLFITLFFITLLCIVILTLARWQCFLHYQIVEIWRKPRNDFHLRCRIGKKLKCHPRSESQFRGEFGSSFAGEKSRATCVTLPST